MTKQLFFVIVITPESLERLEKSVDKNKFSTNFRKWQETIPVKQQLVEMNALKKCLRHRRESTSLSAESLPNYGAYEGHSIDSMRPEIDQIIHDKHPSERRKRKV